MTKPPGIGVISRTERLVRGGTRVSGYCRKGNTSYQPHMCDYEIGPRTEVADRKIFLCFHDDVIEWKHFPRYWPFARGIHRSPVNSSHKGQWRGALMFSLICVWINGWVNNREAGDLRRYRAHYDVIVMQSSTVLTEGLALITDVGPEGRLNTNMLHLKK